MKIPKQIVSKSRLIVKSLLVTILFVNIILVFKPSISSLGQISIYDSLPFFISLMAYPIYLLLFLFICVRHTKSRLDRFFIIYFIAFGIFTVILSILFPLLDKFFYPNFIYSKFHIFTPSLVRFSQVQIMIIVCGLFFLNTKTLKTGLSKSAWIKSNLKLMLSPRNIFGVFLILALYKIIITLPTYVADEYLQQYRVQTMDVDLKYRATDVPLTAYKTLFIRSMTPEDAVIVHPPQSEDFPDIGNEVLIRYFLYPRKLVSYVLLDEYIKDLDNKNCKFYTIIVRSSVDNNIIFPLTSVKTNNIHTLEVDNKTAHKSKTFDRDKIIKDKNFLIGFMENSECKTF